MTNHSMTQNCSKTLRGGGKLTRADLARLINAATRLMREVSR